MKLTAVIICHKGEHCIDRAVGSVLAQSRLPDRLLLLGTDARPETMRALDAIRVRAEQVCNVSTHMTDVPLTCCESKNTAGRLVYDRDPGGAFFTLDYDDWLMPGYIEHVHPYVERHGASVAGCDYWCYWPDRGLMSDARCNTEPITSITKMNVLPSCSIVRAQAWWDAGGYPDGYAWEDWALWLKLHAGGHWIVRYPHKLFCYLRHAAAKSAGDDAQQADEQIKTLARELGL